jgi:hypothetical protein
MQHQEYFNRMREEFEKEEMIFPSLVLDDEGREFFAFIEKESQSLHLSVDILITILPTFPNSLSIESIASGDISIDLTPEVRYKTIYNRDSFHSILVEPQNWHNLPKIYKKESKLIEKLDQHIPTDEDSKSAQNLRVGLDSTWNKLYSELVTQKKLKWANLLGERFPYVTTDSSVLGNVGISEGGLYFVSVDIAKERWQEQVVAFHERFCQSKGHEYAIKKEKELVRHLDKEIEYQRWRKQINTDAINGKYF